MWPARGNTCSVATGDAAPEPWPGTVASSRSTLTPLCPPPCPPRLHRASTALGGSKNVHVSLSVCGFPPPFPRGLGSSCGLQPTAPAVAMVLAADHITTSPRHCGSQLVTVPQTHPRNRGPAGKQPHCQHTQLRTRVPLRKLSCVASGA